MVNRTPPKTPKGGIRDYLSPSGFASPVSIEQKTKRLRVNDKDETVNNETVTYGNETITLKLNDLRAMLRDEIEQL
jgi:hypothetical protein